MICRGRHKAHVADKHGTKQLDAKTAVLLLLMLPDSLGEEARIANAQLASVQVFDSSCMPSHRKILLAATCSPTGNNHSSHAQGETGACRIQLHATSATSMLKAFRRLHLTKLVSL